MKFPTHIGAVLLMGMAVNPVMPQPATPRKERNFYDRPEMMQ
jgi:hypothetical protein